MTLDENDLIEDLKSGQAAGLERLYGLYAKKIYHLAFRILGQKEEAEDIVQETFLNVYRNIDTFDHRSRLYTWIYAITRNLCLRVLQKHKQSSFAGLENAIRTARDLEAPADLTLSEMRYLTQEVREGCLAGLLRCLSFSQRCAFILHVLIGLSVGETAEVLEKSEAATKVLIFRGRENLKKFLCRNCSLYDPENTCRCQNLIRFSLKQGWIEKPLPETLKTADARQIEQEIQTVRNVVQLYQTLAHPEPVENLADRIQKLIADKGLLIFSNPK